MPVVDIVVVGFIVAVFVAFAGTLAWVSQSEQAAKQPAKQQAPQPPLGARHA